MTEHDRDPPAPTRAPDEHAEQPQRQHLGAALAKYGRGHRAKRMVSPVGHNRILSLGVPQSPTVTVAWHNRQRRGGNR